MDHSLLDDKYFVDNYIYNCPFFNRRHVRYSVVADFAFHWTKEKTCHEYLIQCHSCSNISMHLSFTKLPVSNYGHDLTTGRLVANFRVKSEDSKRQIDLSNLDSYFFYSVPSSFFVLDKRIPSSLRDLVSEAEGCLKSNFLTGASACVRKVVYELAVLQGAVGDKYEDRI